jgi:hypothetical protein
VWALKCTTPTTSKELCKCTYLGIQNNVHYNLLEVHGFDFANRSHGYGNHYFLRMLLRGALRSKYSKNSGARLAVT